MPVEQPKRRRGPEPNPERGTPSGYRITDRQRFELSMTAQFLGTVTLQATIDVGVQRLLNEMREDDGFRAALHAAEEYRRRRAGVPRLHDDT